MSNYLEIIKQNLREAFDKKGDLLERLIPARRDGDGYKFRAFGKECTLRADSVILEGEVDTGPKGVIISLYASFCGKESIVLEPFRPFRDFPGSMPYQGPFKVNTESKLIPHTEKIKDQKNKVIERFGGEEYLKGMGDFAFVLYPLPKIALLYDFYLPDDEFPASVTCMFSANSDKFLPLDGLADVGEYTSKEIVEIIK